MFEFSEKLHKDYDRIVVIAVMHTFEMNAFFSMFVATVASAVVVSM